MRSQSNGNMAGERPVELEEDHRSPFRELHERHLVATFSGTA